MAGERGRGHRLRVPKFSSPVPWQSAMWTSVDAVTGRQSTAAILSVRALRPIMAEWNKDDRLE
jgi:hypothetical protein